MGVPASAKYFSNYGDQVAKKARGTGLSTGWLVLAAVEAAGQVEWVDSSCGSAGDGHRLGGRSV